MKDLTLLINFAMCMLPVVTLVLGYAIGRKEGREIGYLEAEATAAEIVNGREEHAEYGIGIGALGGQRPTDPYP